MLTAMMCDHGSAINARSFGPRNIPTTTVDARAPSRARLESAAPLGKPLVPDVWKTATVAPGSMLAGRNGALLSAPGAGARRNPSSVSASSSTCIQVRTLSAARCWMLRSKVALSVTRISVPLLARMRRTSASESIGLSGTAMPPARMIASNHRKQRTSLVR